MKRFLFPITVLLVLLSVTASMSQNAVIQKDTVIPVVLENTLDSGTSRVGDRFNTSCANCCGFPPNTTFVGRIVSVMPASKGVSGQIEVAFDNAILPNKRIIDIDGSLTSLDPSVVATDPATGRMYARPGSVNKTNQFILYGAGAGAAVGIIGSHKKTKGALEGAAIGAAAGWIAGSLAGHKDVYKNVNVPPGTKLGIRLNQDVSLIPIAVKPGGAGGGPGPAPRPSPPPVSITYRNVKPFTTPDKVLMVPFRETMLGLGIPFAYESSTHTLVVNTNHGQYRHVVGTSTAAFGNMVGRLSTSSVVVGQNTFVPVDFVTVITGRPTLWNPDAGMLTVK